jgi:hypothetical protein
MRLASQIEENTFRNATLKLEGLPSDDESMFANNWRNGFVLCRCWKFSDGEGRTAKVTGVPPKWCPYKLEQILDSHEIDMRADSKTTKEFPHEDPRGG